MPAAVKTQADEAAWTRAKAAAKKQGQAGNYRLVMHIFQQIKGGTDKSLYPAGEEPDLRKPTAKAEPDSDEAKIQQGLKRQAQKHRRLADEHRRAQPKGGGTMGRWRQERAHEDAQEAHREAAESSEEAVTDSSKRGEAQDESDAASTHPPAEEVKSMNPILKGLLKSAKQLGLFGGEGKTSRATPAGGGGEGSRGGKIAGHTAAGKPIYEKKDKLGWRTHHYDSPQDAIDHHETMAKRHGRAAVTPGIGKHEAQSHQRAAEDHHSAAALFGQKGKRQVARRISQKANESTADQRKWGDREPPTPHGEGTSTSVKAWSHSVHAAYHANQAALAQLDGDHGRAAAHSKATAAHHEAREHHDRQQYGQVPDQHREDADRASRAAFGHSEAAKGASRSEKAMDPFDDLIKAAEATSAKASEAMGKPPAKPDPAVGAKPAAGDKPANGEPANGDEEGGDEQGTHEHHKDRALAHLQAAQAHATAAHSAKKVEAAKEHSQVVGAAEQASQAAAGMPEQGKGNGKEEPVQKGLLNFKGAIPGTKISSFRQQWRQALEKGMYSKPVGASSRDRITAWADQFLGGDFHLEALKLLREKTMLDAHEPPYAETAAALKTRQAHEAKCQKLCDKMEALQQRYLDQQIQEAEAQKKLGKSIPFRSHTIDVGSEDAVLAHLDAGAVVGGQMAALRYDGRDRLLGMRGERMQKGGVAGGTIYQGEHDEPRGGDLRETAMRAQTLAETVHLDPDGTKGQGGDPAWWKDAAAENPAEIRMRRLVTKGQNPTVKIIDDADPVTKAHRDDVNRVGLAVEMAYHGGGRETKRSGR
jgi:hypothetical protein